MKNTSCSLGRSSFGTLLVVFLSLLALSLPVQSCRLNQNILVQAAGMNQRGQSETNRLNLPDREVADKPSFKSSIPQSAIQNLSSTSIGDPKFEKSEVIQKTKKLQMPFIANNGQTNERVKFYANTFGGTVFVTEDGEIVYALPMVAHASPLVHYDIDKNETGYTGLTGYRGKEGTCLVHHALCTMYPYCTWNFPVYYSETNSPLKRGTHPLIPSREGNGVCNTTPTTRRDTERRVPTTTVALKEQFVGAKVSGIKGEGESVTKVNYFKGKDASKWKTDISTYDVINLGEVYDGIELKLKAYGSNVEKLFCVKPGANPEQIKISLSGIQPSENPSPLSPFVRGTGGCPPLAGAGGGLGASLPVRDRTQTGGLWVNDEGQLEVETELGPVKFTKPIAYQEIDGKRVEVEVAYQIENCKLQNAEQGITHPLPLSRGECKSPLLGGVSGVGCVKPVLSFVEGRSAPNRTGLNLRAGSGLQPEPLNLLNTGVCAIDTISKNINTGVQVANLNPQETSGKRRMNSREKGMGRKGAYITSYLQPSTSNPKLVPDSDLSTTQSGDRGSEIQNLSSTSIGDPKSEHPQSAICNLKSEIDNPSLATKPSSLATHHSSLIYGFAVAAYDKSHDLIIDPLLASTYLGGTGGDSGRSLTLDTSGNVYVTGFTWSTDFPTTSGAYDTSKNDSGDVFVSKLDSGLTSLLASTFLGGSGIDIVYSLTLDTSGNVYVTGVTNSSNFPTTSGAYDTSFSGGDVFVSKLNSGLTSLLASTFLGGSSYDHGNSLTLDTSGNVYVTGFTNSSNFPTTSGAYDTSYNGDYDVFVSKLDSGLTSLLASTYLGGSNYNDNDGQSLTLDTSGNVYVTGYTYSTNFPTTSGAYDTSYNGDYDVFVSKFNSGLTSLLASTYLGGTGGDSGRSLTLDTSGNVYVTGETSSTDFPTTRGAYDTSNSGSDDVFVSKLDGGLTSLLASTYLGGPSYDYGYSLALDTSRNVYVTGSTYSTDFPTTSGAYDASYNGGDVFVSKLNSGLTSLLASTFLGGSSTDEGFSLTLDASGNVYVTGYTYSTNFPTTSGAYDTFQNGSSYNDVFVSKLDGNLSATLTPTPSPSPTPSLSPAPTPSPTTSPEEEKLLEKYAPILYMHPDERYYPIKVEVMLDNSKLYKKRIGEDKPVDLERKKLTLEMLMSDYNNEKYYLRLKKEANKKLKDKNHWKKDISVYGREFPKDGKTVLQYWFFYIYNNWDNIHEGDWEMIQIILGSDNQNQLVPEKITYSIHEGGLPLEWGKSEVSKHDEYPEHPLVFVTLGGHGSWNKPGDHKWYQELGLLDNCFSCTDETIKEDEEGDILYPNIETFSSMGNTTYKLEDISNVPPTHWVSWEGYWGKQRDLSEKGEKDSILNADAVKLVFKTNGPKSPPYIDYIDDEIDGRWKEPIKWGDKPNPSHYTICASANSEVTIQDLEGNFKRANSYCKPGLLCGYCPNIKMVYSEKDLVFDIYSLDGDEVSLKISRHKRTTGEIYNVEFDWLEIPKNGKATLRFSPEQNPNLEMEIDHDHDGIFDYRVSPDYATQNP